MAFRNWARSCCILMVSGCTTYVPPPDTGPGKVAILQGSTFRLPGMFHVKLRAEPANIDGQRVFNNGFTSDQALALTPGRHAINISVFKYGVPVVSGESKIEVSLLAGHDYTIRATQPAPHVNADGQSADWANESHIWIESDGKPITPKFPVYLVAPPPPPLVIIIPVK